MSHGMQNELNLVLLASNFNSIPHTVTGRRSLLAFCGFVQVGNWSFPKTNIGL